MERGLGAVLGVLIGVVAGGCEARPATQAQAQGQPAAADAAPACVRDLGQLPVGPAVLTRACSPYRVPGPGTLHVGDLTIEAGVELRVVGETSVWVKGRLVALGTAAAPIRFVPDAAGAQPAWSGIWFDRGTTGRLEHVVIERAGVADDDHALTITEGAQVRVSHVEIRGGKGPGIYVDQLAAPETRVEHSRVDPRPQPGILAWASSVAYLGAGNDVGVISVFAGRFEEDFTFHAGPTWRLGRIEVVKGATVTLAAGARLELHSFGEIVVRDGALVAAGTPEARVELYAMNADEGWQGLSFQEAAIGRLAHTRIESARNFEGGAVFVNGGQVLLDEVVVPGPYKRPVVGACKGSQVTVKRLVVDPRVVPYKVICK